MSLWKSPHTRNTLTQIFTGVFLCIGYFNFSFVTKSVDVFFQISYLTGQLLVNKFLSVCNGVVEIAKLIYYFMQIIYEDSVIFVKDATEELTFALLLLKKSYVFLEERLQTCFELIVTFCNVLLQVFESGFNFFAFFIHAISSLKGGLHILGSTIWQSIISIPETIILNIHATCGLLKNSALDIVNSLLEVFHEAVKSLEKLYLVLFDIPLDSIYGLLVGAVLLTIFCVKFKELCLAASSGLIKLYRCAVSLCVSLWTGRFLERKPHRNTTTYNPEEDERLCVVCQYQFKEIIIFPCKHLCLCSDCSSQLAKSKQACPLCRTDIKGTLRVYI